MVHLIGSGTEIRTGSRRNIQRGQDPRSAAAEDFLSGTDRNRILTTAKPKQDLNFSEISRNAGAVRAIQPGSYALKTMRRC